MKTDKIKAFLDKKETDSFLIALYGKTALAFQKRRIIGLLRKLGSSFTGSQVRLFRAPGRTELGGNHTDHNHGRVLASSVDLDILAAVVRTDDRRVLLSSHQYEKPVVVTLDSVKKNKSEQGTTKALVRGIAHYLIKAGHLAGGFHAEIDSTVPQGAGLSSSAAIEILIGIIFNALYNDGKIPNLTLAGCAQQAENDYYGKPCGLMDQIACLQGGAMAIDFLHPERPRIQPVHLNPAASGYTLFVIDTGGDHSSLTAAYSAVKDEMRQVASFFGKNTLAEIKPARFLSVVADLRKQKNDRGLLRALFFFQENERVKKQVAALGKNDFRRFLELVKESGRSSWELLQNCYLPEKPREQGISLALALSHALLGDRGAARVHGGGFQGTIQCYVPLGEARRYKSFMESVFGRGSVIELSISPAGAVEICRLTAH